MFELPEQIVVVPFIAPGVAGELSIVIACDAADEVPHPLLAVTVTLPAVEFAVAVIEFIVDVPVQPLGNVHV